MDKDEMLQIDPAVLLHDDGKVRRLHIVFVIHCTLLWMIQQIGIHILNTCCRCKLPSLKMIVPKLGNQYPFIPKSKKSSNS